MFRSLFNYTKLSIWSVIFLLNFKIYDKVDLDLLQILLYNIQNTNSLAIKCIQKLIPYLKMSNTRKEIIDILNDVYENNIYHRDNISLKMFKNDFNDNFYNKYLLLERLSSGSIGQVYKIQEIESGKIYAMKVIHPTIDSDIKFILNMIYIFNIKNYTFFELDVFINNFINETDFIQEANNMIKFCEIYENNNHIIIPKVKEYSKNIIIMEYIDGENVTNLNIYRRSRTMLLFILFCNNNKYIENFNHGDMHFGNFKNNNNRLVVYDFGFCFQVNDDMIVEILDNFYHTIIDFSRETKYSLRECIEYLVKYHIGSEDIKIYENDINEIFLKKKMSGMDELAMKSIYFFTKNNIKIKIEYLNLIINFYYTSEYNDCNVLELLSFCQAYNVFPQYMNIIKDMNLYRKEEKFENIVLLLMNSKK